MNKIVRIVFYAIIVLVIVIGLIAKIWLGDGMRSQMQGSSIGLILSYILMGIAVVGALLASVVNVIQNPKLGIKTAIGIIAIVAIFFIGYAISRGEVTDAYISFGVDTASASKYVDAGLYLLYALLGITIGGILVSEFLSIVKGKN